MKPSKRCPALSPGAHLQCELKKGHIKRDYRVGILNPMHRVMNTTWSNEEGSLVTTTGSSVAVGGLSAQGVSWPTPDEWQSFVFQNAMSSAPEPLDSERELRAWWFDKAESEIELVVPKAVEYGSTDLIDIGLMLARTMRRTITEEEAAELGVFFYLIGKIARWQSAIERGERPSDDTLLDIGVYVRMAQRIRDAGGWPGIKET